MKFYSNRTFSTVYTADDEEPDCMKCDNCGNCTGGVLLLLNGEHKKDPSFRCGSEYGWANYKRTGFDIK